MSSSSSPLKISVSDNFDGGNIRHVEQRPSPDDEHNTTELVLEVKPDVYTELEERSHLQYFCFRIIVEQTNDAAETETSNSTTHKIKFVLDNAEYTSYCEAWSGFTVFVTQNVDDPDSWTRNVDTFYMGGKLTWEQEFALGNDSGKQQHLVLQLLSPLLVRPPLGPGVQMQHCRELSSHDAGPEPAGPRNRVHLRRHGRPHGLDHSPAAPGRGHGRVLRGGAADAVAGVGQQQ